MSTRRKLADRKIAYRNEGSGFDKTRLAQETFVKRKRLIAIRLANENVLYFRAYETAYETAYQR